MISKREMQKITITEKEAIKLLNESYIVDYEGNTDRHRINLEKFLISTLEEIHQYREIGTVEECREAMEKQKKKRLVEWADGTLHFPNCEHDNTCLGFDVCVECGQILGGGRMRLIDADELIKDRVENDPVRIAATCAPTAYDVEAVSKALKNEMELVVNGYPVYGRYIKKNRAIEILHSGVIPQKPQESPDGKRLREREEFFEER